MKSAKQSELFLRLGDQVQLLGNLHFKILFSKILSVKKEKKHSFPQGAATPPPHSTKLKFIHHFVNELNVYKRFPFPGRNKNNIFTNGQIFPFRPSERSEEIGSPLLIQASSTIWAFLFSPSE
jgi:hypothetical protein